MNEKNEVIVGNVTTIITTVSLAFAGLIIGILASYGLKLPIDQTSLAGLIGTVIMTIFSLINAKYHNTFFDGDTLRIQTDNLTDAQITAIEGFVENAVQLNKTSNGEDPSLAYEDDDGGC